MGSPSVTKLFLGCFVKDDASYKLRTNTVSRDVECAQNGGGRAFAQVVATDSDVCCTEFLGRLLLLLCAQ